jgi:hypothetical protein
VTARNFLPGSYWLQFLIVLFKCINQTQKQQCYQLCGRFVEGLLLQAANEIANKSVAERDEMISFFPFLMVE